MLFNKFDTRQKDRDVALLAGQLEMGMKELSQTEKQLLWLAYYEDLNLLEIGYCMGMPLDVCVKSLKSAVGKMSSYTDAFENIGLFF